MQLNGANDLPYNVLLIYVNLIPLLQERLIWMKVCRWDCETLPLYGLYQTILSCILHQFHSIPFHSILDDANLYPRLASFLLLLAQSVAVVICISIYIRFLSFQVWAELAFSN